MEQALCANTMPGHPPEVCLTTTLNLQNKLLGRIYLGLFRVLRYFRLRASFRVHRDRMFQHSLRLTGALLFLVADAYPACVSVAFETLRAIFEMEYKRTKSNFYPISGMFSAVFIVVMV